MAKKRDYEQENILKIKTRAWNVLRVSGIRFLGSDPDPKSLAKLSRADLLRLGRTGQYGECGLGKVSIQMIENWLHHRGLKLSAPIEPCLHCEIKKLKTIISGLKVTIEQIENVSNARISYMQETMFLLRDEVMKIHKALSETAV